MSKQDKKIEEENPKVEKRIEKKCCCWGGKDGIHCEHCKELQKKRNSLSNINNKEVNTMSKEETIQDRFVKMDRNNIEAYTPKYAIDIILPYISKEMTIWSPFSRDEHNFANYLRELGYKVINTHFNPETGEGDDFLTYSPEFDFDIILDNPPFKGKTKYVERAFSFNKPFALFLPFNAFGDNGIPNLFIKNNVEPQLLIPDKRTEFKNQKQKGISFKTIYICRDILPKQIIFTKLIK